jgi:hypothetical protein
MTESAFFIEILKNTGFPALIFIIWYIYHRSQVKMFEAIISNNFSLLKDMIETTSYNTSLLTQITELIKSNQFCPYMRKELKP